MNEKPLSPREHDELRGSVVSGLSRMRAARARRLQVAGAVSAFLLVVAVVGGVITASLNTGAGPVTTPTPTTTAAPSPSPTPTASQTGDADAFDGRCDELGLETSIAAALGVDAVTVAPDSLQANPPGLGASARAAGGGMCDWRASDGNGVTVTVLPEAIVPADASTAWQEFSCDGRGACGHAEIIGGSWVLITAQRRDDDQQAPIPAAEADRLRGVVDAVFGSVRDSGVVPRVANSGVEPGRALDCAPVAAVVVSVGGVNSPQEGYPSDVFPEGPVWEALVGDGRVQWCAWYDDSGRAFEIYLQPGAGAPSPESLSAAGATTIPVPAVPGLDAAWELTTGDRRIVGVIGGDRVTVGGTDPTVLAELAAAAAAAEGFG